MATVYSLVCWGGRTGKSVTASNSSGLIFTLTNHGLRDGTGIVFSGTTPPGNVTFGTTYYAKSLSTSTFAIYTEPELTNRVAWSSAGSGVIAKSKKMLDYFDQYPGRWGDSGSERCYDGLAAWVSGRASASPLDQEFLELGQAFTENITAQITVSVPSAATTIQTTIDGAWTEAFHGGVVGAGYILNASSSGPYYVFALDRDYASIRGFSITAYSGFYSAEILRAMAFSPSIRQMIVLGPGGVSSIGGNATCVNLSITGATCIGNLVAGGRRGIGIGAYGAGLLVANNTVTKCGTGFYTSSSTNITGNFYNNISLGNTTNWATAAGFTNAANNAGLSGEAWVSGSYSRITMATTDFYSYPTNLHPALSTSPQVDTGTDYYGALGQDVSGAEMPNYNNGGAEAYDVGCYEFDHGYGDHPITATLTLAGLASGTDAVVRAAGSSTILDSVDSTSGNWTYTYGTAHNVDIDVIKPGMVIVTFRNLALTAESSILPVSQQPDRNYA